MVYKIADVHTKVEWDEFISAHNEANFLHAWQWGEFQNLRNKKVLRRGVYHNGLLMGIYSASIETSRRGTYMVIAGGPIIDWTKKGVVQTLVDDMRSEAVRHGCIFIRVRPQLERSEKSLQIFTDLGFVRAPMHLSVEHAGVLDLHLPEEEILKGMRQRLRRALRKAEKSGISIETSTNSDDIDTFYNIQLQTAGRHSFVPFGREFLKKQFAAFAETGNAVLYTAKHEGEILAQNFMIFYGTEASYHYGVSTEKGTRLSGAPLLHMEAMREARKRHITRYNFWGIVPEEATKHRFYGVSTFKRGFGVTDLYYVPTHDLVIKPLRYKAVWLLESARRKHRSL